MIGNIIHRVFEFTDRYISDNEAREILALISEDIEKVKNPCLYQRDIEASEAMRQAILNLFRPKGNVVGSAEL